MSALPLRRLFVVPCKDGAGARIFSFGRWEICGQETLAGGFDVLKSAAVCFCPNIAAVGFSFGNLRRGSEGANCGGYGGQGAAARRGGVLWGENINGYRYSAVAFRRACSSVLCVFLLSVGGVEFPRRCLRVGRVVCFLFAGRRHGVPLVVLMGGNGFCSSAPVSCEGLYSAVPVNCKGVCLVVPVRVKEFRPVAPVGARGYIRRRKI